MTKQHKHTGSPDCSICSAMTTLGRELFQGINQVELPIEDTLILLTTLLAAAFAQMVTPSTMLLATKTLVSELLQQIEYAFDAQERIEQTASDWPEHGPASLARTRES